MLLEKGNTIAYSSNINHVIVEYLSNQKNGEKFYITGGENTELKHLEINGVQYTSVAPSSPAPP